MFEQMPYSGLMLCYGPLALIFLGFVISAARTDKHARRLYLRRLDPRADNERPDSAAVKRDQPVTAQTPAGMTVTLTADK